MSFVANTTAVTVGLFLLGLGVTLAVDKRRPLRCLDDRPQLPIEDFGGGDLWAHADNYERAELALGRQL